MLFQLVIVISKEQLMKSVTLLMVNVYAKKALVDLAVTSVWMVGLTFQIAKHVNVRPKDQAQMFVMSRMDNVIATPTLEDGNAHNVPLDSIAILLVLLVNVVNTDLRELHVMTMAGVPVKKTT